MRKFLRTTKALLVAAGLCMGANTAWADAVTLTKGKTIGATDNSDGWYGSSSEIVEIGHHQTLTLKFKTYTATDEQLKGKGENDADLTWSDQFTHVINMWDGRDQNFYFKGCGWGWKAHTGSTNDPEDYDVNNTTYAYYQKNVGWGNDYRTMIGEGADVVMTIQRFGTKFRIFQEFTTSTGAKYQHYLVGTFGTADGSVWCQMATDHSHFEITADKVLTTSADPTITGTLIGSEDNTTVWWTQFSDNFILKANESLSLKIKNYSNKVNNYNNFVAYVTNDVTRNDTENGYVEYMGLRADKWVLAANAEATHNYLTACPNSAETDIDWDAFRDKLDGATVTITVTRSGASITTSASIEPADGSTTLTESYTKSDCGDGTQDVRVFLAVEGGHLDLLPVETTISAYGWSTFSSDYALDFSKATEGLTAYMITGHDGNTVTKSEVTGTVPAGTGLLLKGTASTAYNIPIVGSSSTDVSSNLLVAGTGASIAKEDGKTKYVLGVNDNNTGGDTSDDYAEFQKIDGTAATVAKGKAYLQFNETIAARSLSFDFDESTGISTVEGSQLMANGEYYNLSGQRVAAPQKGLYIVNGKKVVLK